MSDGDDDELYELVAPEAGRLDAVIAGAIAELSRTQAQRLIDEGRVELRGAVATKANARVEPGDAICVHVPPPEPLDVRPEAIPLAIVHEDDDVIVIDKPAGMVVHPAAGHASGTLVNALLAHCKDLSGIGGVARPGIVHRLDKDTSGLIVATKHDRAHAALAAAFAAKSAGEPTSIERAYLGLVDRAPAAARGAWRTLHGRHPVDRKRFSSKVATGKSAVTEWEIVERFAHGALLRFRLQTGRTHQIRVHCADHGSPLVGDAVYGKRSPLVARQALHAALLAFDQPTTGAHLRFESPLPADLQHALEALRASR